MVTTVSAAAGTLTWVGASYLKGRKVSVVGAAAGAVAGLVAITPAAGFVTVGGALVLGLRGRCGLLRASRCCASAWPSTTPSMSSPSTASAASGARSAPASSRSRPSVASPASSRATPSSSSSRSSAVAFTVVFASVMTFIIIKVIDVAIGLRVNEADEEAGLDVAVHGETAYVPWAGTSSGAIAARHRAGRGDPGPATEAEPA